MYTKRCEPFRHQVAICIFAKLQWRKPVLTRELPMVQANSRTKEIPVKVQDIAQALAAAVVAHCRDAGIADAGVQVSAGGGNGYVAAVSSNARHCFETLFVRVFDRQPEMAECGYVIEEQDAFDLARLEPYYSPPSNWHQDFLLARHTGA